MRCEHEHEDGAYVLGALSPAERAAYEQHLATCSFCREAVADIAVLPGLLGRLDAADYEKLLDPTLSSAPRRLPPKPPTRRRNTRVRALSTAAAAVVAAVVIGVGTMFVLDDSPAAVVPTAAAATPAVAMTTLDEAVPISARISLAGASGGTRISIQCRYEKTSGAQMSYTLRLMAYGPDNEEDQSGSWVASPGREFAMAGTTHFAEGTLTRLSLVRNDGKVLLTYDVP